MVLSQSGAAFMCPRDATAVAIPVPVTPLEASAFTDATLLEVVTFKRGSKLDIVLEGPFGACKSVRPICFSASLGYLPGAFALHEEAVSPLGTVTFEARSRLRAIDENAILWIIFTDVDLHSCLS
jgi:hypothetical protein